MGRKCSCVCSETNPFSLSLSLGVRESLLTKRVDLHVDAADRTHALIFFCSCCCSPSPPFTGASERRFPQFVGSFVHFFPPSSELSCRVIFLFSVCLCWGLGARRLVVVVDANMKRVEGPSPWLHHHFHHFGLDLWAEKSHNVVIYFPLLLLVPFGFAHFCIFRAPCHVSSSPQRFNSELVDGRV